jgi:hypothetical protein
MKHPWPLLCKRIRGCIDYRRMCARSTAFILIFPTETVVSKGETNIEVCSRCALLEGGVCLPRKKKVVDPSVILEGTENKKTFKCLRCGKEYDVAVNHFYKITYSPL